MFIIEVIDFSGVQIDFILLRGVSNVLTAPFTNMSWQLILETHHLYTLHITIYIIQLLQMDRPM